MRFLLIGQRAYVNVYILDDELATFKTKVFEHYDEEWLDYD